MSFTRSISAFLLAFVIGAGVTAAEPPDAAQLVNVADSQQMCPNATANISAGPPANAQPTALGWWEYRLDRCGKNTNCGSGVNFDEGFWSKRWCSCHNPYCGSWSCGPWNFACSSCGCSSHPSC